ncbi:cupredoxin domain-containing protein [Hyalangium rubrum]|uniref:Cupredoxin domain-containing protein n=1 Tax=Hyalangium rubrum TaxID=3103134 RepID=A0ABU5H2V5_9BACT|nr:cupredoxin domain-containing protein [Hyalangium sp. s54d21]MDY7227128.1 cupredoxin domain-containing protein [Hyalangium sp. s54d21]
MKRLMGVVVVAGLLAACDKKTQAPAAPPAETAKASAKQPHAAEPHAHAAPHGGWVETTARGHLELVASREGGYRVYLLDDALSPRPVDGASGSIKVAKGGYPDVALSVVGDHLEGQGPAHTDEHLVMVVTVVREGKPETARFNAHLEAEGHGDLMGELRQEPCPSTLPEGLTAEQCAKQGGVYTVAVQGGAPVLVLTAPGQDAKALLGPKVGQRVHIAGAVEEVGGSRRVQAEALSVEHDHTPLQGGIVAMSGDMHLEVLSLRSGEVRVWVTDAFRKPVPLAGMKGTVEAGGQNVPLTPEPGGQFLAAKLPASEQERETTVRLPMPGDPEYFITFLLAPKDGSVAVASPAAKADASGVQEVTITVAGGYSPSEVKLKKGMPVRLRFIRKDTGGCADELLIPDFGVKQPLPGLTETVVEFTPDKTGSFPFTCGMRMLKGTLVVN